MISSNSLILVSSVQLVKDKISFIMQEVNVWIQTVKVKVILYLLHSSHLDDGVTLQLQFNHLKKFFEL